MKNPAASSGVSEEGELSVLMELLINPSLLLDMDILAHPSILRPKGRGINPGLYLKRIGFLTPLAGLTLILTLVDVLLTLTN
jgi:hypothetical protein